MSDTNAWLRVKQEIDQHTRTPNPIEVQSVPAVYANPRGKKKMASRKQIAAARRNIKKAQAARRKTRGGRKAKRRRNTTSRKKNSWKGNTAGHRKAAKKGVRKVKRRRAKARASSRRRRRRNPTAAPSTPSTRSRSASRTRSNSRNNSTTSRVSRTASVKVVKVPGQTKIVRMANPTRRRKNSTKRRKNPSRSTSTALRGNTSGMLDGLFSNPAGPFTVRSMKNFAVAASGLGIGLYGANLVDRLIATRTPTDGERPWYGRDAAAAQLRRPDAYRLGGQGALALAAMALTYLTRKGKILPFLTGGIAVGAGANLFKMVADWWISPAVFSVKDPGEESFANRAFPLEQTEVQDSIDKFFENWQSQLTLAAAQAPTLVPGAIESPLAAANVSAGAYALGKAPRAGEEFYLTGRLGKCSSCGGDGGCYASCTDFCPPCSYNVGVSDAVKHAPQCDYDVLAGDNFGAIAALAGVSPDAIAAMNGGGAPETFWKVGSKVRLPYAMCKHLDGQRPGVAGQPEEPPKPVIPPPVAIATGNEAAEAEKRARSFGSSSKDER